MALKKRLITITAVAGGFFFLTLFTMVAVVGIFTFSAYEAQSRTTNYNYQQQPPRMGTMDDVDRGGQLVAIIDGQQVAMPALKTDYDVEVRGDLVHVALTQRFENPTDEQIHAVYEFPLNRDAAVHDMTMIVGDQRIRAEIKEKVEAKKTFEKAKSEGKSASLLVQKRPNVFTQNVANIGAKDAIEIKIDYVHAVRKFDGNYELTLPLIVGPRFNPADLSANTIGGEQAEVVEGNPEDADPATLDSDRVSINVRIDSGLPLDRVESASHKVVTNRIATGDWKVELAKSRVLDNKHFELQWRYAVEDPTAGLMSSWNPSLNQGHVSVLLEAPEVPAGPVMKREMVFLLDCSGSMSGPPMEASKAFMRKALKNLRPTDTFRVIRFSDTATEFSTEPLLATPDNVERGIDYVNNLYGGGGTMMSSGIKQALDVPGDPETLRLVTFLTDGYIGNDFEILKLVDERIGNSRLYAIGVGNGVNTYLMDEIGNVGRGFTRYIDPHENVDHVATELAERLQSPVMTDIEVDWGDTVTDVYPRRIPDLFAGQSVRLVGSYAQPGETVFNVHGMVGGKRVTIPVKATLAGTDTRGVAIQQTWARTRVKALMQDMTSHPDRRVFGMDEEELKTAVTHMGLEYRLMTQWTSFVAVADVPTNSQPNGTQTESLNPAPSMSFVSGAPEPGTIGGLLLMGAAGWASRRRRKKQA